ncbi:MAG: pirin family protein [Halieaceae bacterium]|jgi:redox-sensitive bicupin YhaK (pirin superfamily)|nr:pirin family protein [Halieaceae bacterium]
MTIRPGAERGVANFGWLDSRHSFSFGHYFDQRYMGHGPLRVINEDRVKPGRGFDTHGHSDMEIISYVLDGALEHQDSMGNGSVIRPGDVQRMSAGTGVRHSEYNASDSDEVHFLQIWILPEDQGAEPGYEQKAFGREDKLNQLRLVGARDGRDGAVVINRDVDLYASVLEPGHSVSHRIGDARKGWLQVARGSLLVNGERLEQGDGAALDGAESLAIEAVEEAEFLLFDMG